MFEINGEDVRHKRLCELVKAHCEKHPNNVVLDHYYYDRNGLNGEVDVLVANRYGLWFYEIKSKHHSTAWHKAQEQYKRFKDAHKGFPQYIKGVYVTPEKIKRLG